MAKCRKCHDIIESKDRHDFVTCTCGAISVDGGQDYFRRVGNFEDFEHIIYKKEKHHGNKSTRSKNRKSK